jgi:hypothetical protein
MMTTHPTMVESGVARQLKGLLFGVASTALYIGVCRYQ